MSRRTGRGWAIYLLGAALGVMTIACDDHAVVPTAPAPDAGIADAAAEATACSVAPTTHPEIINACTDAVKIEKNPALPLLRPDGTLPPLP